MIKKNSLSNAVKFLLLLSLALAGNMKALSPASKKNTLTLTPGSRFNLHFPADNMLNLQNNLTSFPAANFKKNRLDITPKYRGGLLSDSKRTMGAPSYWKKSDWLTVAVVTAITVGIYFNDQPIMSRVQKNRGKTTKKLSTYGEFFGNPYKVLPTLVLLYGYGSIFKDRKAKEIALLSAESIFICSLFVYGLKVIGHRHRPGGGKYNKWDGPSLKFSNLSFPSGHSAMAFCLAAVVSSKYKSPVIRAIAYGTAALTAFSRVHDKKHWASDVFFGAAIGYFVTRRILKNMKKDEQNPARPGAFINLFPDKWPTKGIRVFPLIDFNRLGISMSFEF